MRALIFTCISLYCCYLSSAQDSYDGLVLYHDSLTINNTIFIEGETIAFFIGVKNVKKTESKFYTSTLHGVVTEDIKNITNTTPIESCLKFIGGRRESVNDQRFPELWKAKFPKVQPNFSKVLLVTPSMCKYHNSDAALYYSNISGLSSGHFPWLLKPGEYSVTIACNLSPGDNKIKKEIAFEIFPFPNEEVKNDYIFYLKCLENRMLKAYVNWDAEDNTDYTLYSYVKNNEGYYSNEALAVLLFPEDSRIKNNLPRGGIDQEALTLFDSLLINKNEVLKDWLIYKMLDYHKYDLFMRHQDNLNSYGNQILKSLESHHPMFSDQIIEYLNTRFNITGLTNYAREKK